MVVAVDMSSAPRLRRLEREAVADRLSEMIALLEVVDQAELFGEVPEKNGARTRHELGSTLLGLLGRQLRELRLVVASPPVDLTSDLVRATERRD